MGIGTTAAVVGGSLAGAGIGAWGAKSAANTQAGAAKSAAELQYEESQNALNFQKEQWSQQQANEAPFLAAGSTAVNKLSDYAPFQAPSAADAASEPGYEFTRQQGLSDINKMAAATGNVFSGNTLTSAAKYGEGLADTTYNEAYNRALNTYNVNLNRLQSLAGEGLTSAGQLGAEGQSAAGNIGNIDMATGQQIGRSLQDEAAAQASGYVGTANAVGGAVNGLSQYAVLQNLLGNSGSNVTAGIDLSAVPDPGITSAYLPPIQG